MTVVTSYGIITVILFPINFLTIIIPVILTLSGNANAFFKIN